MGLQDRQESHSFVGTKEHGGEKHVRPLCIPPTLSQPYLHNLGIYFCFMETMNYLVETYRKAKDSFFSPPRKEKLLLNVKKKKKRLHFPNSLIG
jgi:hypothetical protein